MKKIIALVFLLQLITVNSQKYVPKIAGLTSENENQAALINAKLYSSPDQEVSNGILFIKNGKVVGSGSNMIIHENSVIIDLKGKSTTLPISKGNALDLRGNLLSRAFIDGRDISLETHETKLWKRYMEKFSQAAE